ncbi:ribose 5-phosphate isomerase B [Desulfovibrio sp. OttesenSCG-928-G11]|nr:ribose 5-phosphate isomerase B [Desulfovibrio sp. OttesenSCG-928-G11]
MPDAPLFIASDHAGFALKSHLCRHLQGRSLSIEDLGPHSDQSVDYPDYAHALCARVLQSGGRGILICGTGIGMCMAANRHQGIRAALCTHEFQARSCREHNDANILCLAERITAPALAARMADLFLSAAFDGGRHEKRVRGIEVLS